MSVTSPWLKGNKTKKTPTPTPPNPQTPKANKEKRGNSPKMSKFLAAGGSISVSMLLSMHQCGCLYSLLTSGGPCWWHHQGLCKPLFFPVFVCLPAISALSASVLLSLHPSPAVPWQGPPNRKSSALLLVGMPCALCDRWLWSTCRIADTQEKSLLPDA